MAADEAPDTAPDPDAVLLQRLLGLPGWRVEAIDETGELLKVTVRPPPPGVCKTAAGLDGTEQGAGDSDAARPKRCQARKLIAMRRESLVVRDVPIRGVPVELHVIRYRYRCPKCKRTFSWRPPEIHPTRPTTLRLDDWIWGQALRRTFADVAEDVGVHKSTILRTFMAEYKEREHQPKRRVGRPTKLAWLGIDEVYLLSIKRSQRVREGRTTAPDNDGRKEPQCILTDIGNGQVVDLLQDREPDTVHAALERLRDQRCRPELVTMDMWAPYRDAVWKVFGRETVIVVDKFHVVQMIKKAFQEARKETEGQLRRQAKQAGIAEAQKLNEARKAIRRSTGKFLMSDRFLAQVKDGGEEMRQTLEEHLILADTRGATRDLFRIYRMRTPSEAANYYEIWKKSLDPKLWKYFGGVFSSFEQWGREILNYWDYPRATNAYTESANGRLKWRRRLGAGYEFETYRAFALYAVSRPRSARHESPKTRQKRLARRKAQLRRDMATEALTEETYAQRCRSKLMRPRPADGLQFALEL